MKVLKNDEELNVKFDDRHKTQVRNNMTRFCIFVCIATYPLIVVLTQPY